MLTAIGPGWLIFFALLAVIFTGASLFALHKARAMHLQVFRIEARIDLLAKRDLPKMWRQVEALLALSEELNLMPALSPTRQWAASPDVLLELVRHVRRARPQRIVECGSGASTVAIARMLQQNGAGHILSLDHDEKFAEVTRQRLAEAGLTEYATVVTAPLRTQRFGDRDMTWYDAPPLQWPALDMVVVDGPPETGGTQARYPAGPVLVAKLAGGGCAFIDDSARADEQAIAARWVKELPGLRLEERPWFDKGLIILHKAA